MKKFKISIFLLFFLICSFPVLANEINVPEDVITKISQYDYKRGENLIYGYSYVSYSQLLVTIWSETPIIVGDNATNKGGLATIYKFDIDGNCITLTDVGSLNYSLGENIPLYSNHDVYNSDGTVFFSLPEIPPMEEVLEEMKQGMIQQTAMVKIILMMLLGTISWVILKTLCPRLLKKFKGLYQA